MGLARCCVGLAMLAACGGGNSEPPWAVVAQGEPAALLSVSGTADNDVWVVGGDPRDGTGPIVEHFDGTTWTKLDSTVRNVDLWWVHAFDDGTVFMSGTNGTILEYQDGAFTQLTTPGALVVFGIYGAASNDVWAVGGKLGGGGGGFAWRYDGTSWGSDMDVGSDIETSGTIWKVNGTSASDVWMSGTNGTTFHWDGSQLSEDDIAAAAQEQASLFSIAGNANRFVTVGSAVTDGVLYENTGSDWTSAIPSGGPLLTGVALADDDEGYAVGQFGAILHRSSGGGWSTDGKPVTTQNLHGTWIDPSGGAWAVGGSFDSSPTTEGVVLHKGDPLQGSFQ